VATVLPDGMELELKEIAITNEGGRLWQMGDNRPQRIVRIADDVRQKGFVSVGKASLRVENERATIKDATGCFASVQEPAKK